MFNLVADASCVVRTYIFEENVDVLGPYCFVPWPFVAAPRGIACV